jgi:hypothetical protein
MLVPIFAFGCILGLGDLLIRRTMKNFDLMQSVRVVVMWSSMCSFEVSWVIMIGTFASLLLTLLMAGFAFEKIFRLGDQPALSPAMASG